MKPTLSPKEAQRRLAGGTFIREGFEYLEEPDGSPSAFSPDGKVIWFTTGEPGDPVTAESEWVK